MKFGGDDFGGHGFSRAGMAGVECVDTFAERELSAKSPLAVDDILMPGPSAHFSELGQLIGWQHKIGPVILGIDFASELRQVMTQTRTSTGK